MVNAAFANQLPAAGFTTLLLLFVLFLLGLRVKWGREAPADAPVHNIAPKLTLGEQIAALQAGGETASAPPRVPAKPDRDSAPQLKRV
jgi:hypothetical protein